MILLGIPVWAALGNERIPRIATPDSVSRLILLPDNYRAGRLAVPLAMKAQAVSGRRIETIWPWNDRNDWNDVLRHGGKGARDWRRSEEHTSELQSLMRISYAVFCLKKKNKKIKSKSKSN